MNYLKREFMNFISNSKQNEKEIDFENDEKVTVAKERESFGEDENAEEVKFIGDLYSDLGLGLGSGSSGYSSSVHEASTLVSSTGTHTPTSSLPMAPNKTISDLKASSNPASTDLKMIKVLEKLALYEQSNSQLTIQEKRLLLARESRLEAIKENQTLLKAAMMKELLQFSQTKRSLDIQAQELKWKQVRQASLKKMQNRVLQGRLEDIYSLQLAVRLEMLKEMKKIAWAKEIQAKESEKIFLENVRVRQLEALRLFNAQQRSLADSRRAKEDKYRADKQVYLQRIQVKQKLHFRQVVAQLNSLSQATKYRLSRTESVFLESLRLKQLEALRLFNAQQRSLADSRRAKEDKYRADKQVYLQRIQVKQKLHFRQVVAQLNSLSQATKYRLSHTESVFLESIKLRQQEALKLYNAQQRYLTSIYNSQLAQKAIVHKELLAFFQSKKATQQASERRISQQLDLENVKAEIDRQAEMARLETEMLEKERREMEAARLAELMAAHEKARQEAAEFAKEKARLQAERLLLFQQHQDEVEREAQRLAIEKQQREQKRLSVTQIVLEEMYRAQRILFSSMLRELVQKAKVLECKRQEAQRNFLDGLQTRQVDAQNFFKAEQSRLVSLHQNQLVLKKIMLKQLLETWWAKEEAAKAQKAKMESFERIVYRRSQHVYRVFEELRLRFYLINLRKQVVQRSFLEMVRKHQFLANEEWKQRQLMEFDNLIFKHSPVFHNVLQELRMKSHIISLQKLVAEKQYLTMVREKQQQAQKSFDLELQSLRFLAPLIIRKSPAFLKVMEELRLRASLLALSKMVAEKKYLDMVRSKQSEAAIIHQALQQRLYSIYKLQLQRKLAMHEELLAVFEARRLARLEVERRALDKIKKRVSAIKRQSQMKTESVYNAQLAKKEALLAQLQRQASNKEVARMEAQSVLLNFISMRQREAFTLHKMREKRLHAIYQAQIPRKASVLHQILDNSREKRVALKAERKPVATSLIAKAPIKQSQKMRKAVMHKELLAKVKRYSGFTAVAVVADIPENRNFNSWSRSRGSNQEVREKHPATLVNDPVYNLQRKKKKAMHVELLQFSQEARPFSSGPPPRVVPTTSKFLNTDDEIAVAAQSPLAAAATYSYDYTDSSQGSTTDEISFEQHDLSVRKPTAESPSPSSSSSEKSNSTSVNVYQGNPQMSIVKSRSSAPATSPTSLPIQQFKEIDQLPSGCCVSW